MKLKYYIDCLYPYSEKISKEDIPQFIKLQRKLFLKLNINTDITIYSERDSIYPIIFLDKESGHNKQKIRVSKKLYRRYLSIMESIK